jgi:hypothetical protein
MHHLVSCVPTQANAPALCELELTIYVSLCEPISTSFQRSWSLSCTLQLIEFVGNLYASALIQNDFSLAALELRKAYTWTEIGPQSYREC